MDTTAIDSENSNTDIFFYIDDIITKYNNNYFSDNTFLSISSESDVDLVSMATGITPSSITADSALGTLTATRSQVTTGASQFNEVSSNVIWSRITIIFKAESSKVGTTETCPLSFVVLSSGVSCPCSSWPII